MGSNTSLKTRYHTVELLYVFMMISGYVPKSSSIFQTLLFKVKLEEAEVHV